MQKLLFIVNPKAGKRKSTAPLFDAVARFSQAGYLGRLFVTTAGGDAYQAAAETAQDYDLVVCAGGDGTLNEVISGLMTREKRPLLQRLRVAVAFTGAVLHRYIGQDHRRQYVFRQHTILEVAVGAVFHVVIVLLHHICGPCLFHIHK